MTAALSNATRDLCAICFVEYGKNEIHDVDKTIQLVCGHIFHTACVAQHAGFREAGRDRIRCCYCNQTNAPQARESNVLASKEIYLAKLKEVQEEYDYDVIALVPYLSEIYDPLHGLYQEASKLSKSYASERIDRFIDSIKSSETIKEELKPDALEILNRQIFKRLLAQDFFIYQGPPSTNYITHQQFETWLQEIGEQYSDDVASSLSALYDPLNELFKEVAEYSQTCKSNLAPKYADYIKADKKLLDEDKLTAMRMLGAMFTGDSTLRNVKQEAKRWWGKDLPDRIKQNGVLVIYPKVPNAYESFRARISADQLRKHIEAVEQEYQREVRQEILRPYIEQAERVRAAVGKFLTPLTRPVVIGTAMRVIGKVIMEVRK